MPGRERLTLHPERNSLSLLLYLKMYEGFMAVLAHHIHGQVIRDHGCHHVPNFFFQLSLFRVFASGLF